jgi:hypothetical protein
VREYIALDGPSMGRLELWVEVLNYVTGHIEEKAVIVVA